MDILVKLKFPTHQEIRISTFLSVFSLSKCHLSPIQWIVISKLAHIEISLIVTKLSLYCLKCCTMDPWLKLMFHKLFEIRIWTFWCVFTISKCRPSPRLGIDISKCVYLVISLTIKKFSFFSVFSVSKFKVSNTSWNQNLYFLECI